jgi:hypothetical protein
MQKRNHRRLSRSLTRLSPEPYAEGYCTAMEGGTHRQASMSWMVEAVPAAATPRRAVPRLARDGGRHTSTSVHAWTQGGASRRHTAQSRSRTCPRRWEARTGKRGCRPPSHRA